MDLTQGNSTILKLNNYNPEVFASFDVISVTNNDDSVIGASLKEEKSINCFIDKSFSHATSIRTFEHVGDEKIPELQVD